MPTSSITGRSSCLQGFVTLPSASPVSSFWVRQSKPIALPDHVMRVELGSGEATLLS
jgi:hypothetical protein